MTAPRFEGDPPTHFLSPLLEEAGVPHLFTTRHFPGVTAFRDPFPPLGEAARPLLGACGLAGKPAAFLKQVHGAQVVAVRDGGLAGQADALVTDTPGLPIAVFSADCLPLLLYDPDGRRLAAAHAGWRGTVESVARAGVEALVEAGGRPERFLAAVGPSIGPCCYEVDKPVIAQLDRAFAGQWGAWVKSVGAGKWMLDLWAANEDQLCRAGLRGDRISNPRLCTACRTDLFYSYRRGHHGRLVSIAALPAWPPDESVVAVAASETRST
jgi:YfiH family protein